MRSHLGEPLPRLPAMQLSNNPFTITCVSARLCSPPSPPSSAPGSALRVHPHPLLFFSSHLSVFQFILRLALPLLLSRLLIVHTFFRSLLHFCVAHSLSLSLSLSLSAGAIAFLPYAFPTLISSLFA
eukprot:RCo010587